VSVHQVVRFSPGTVPPQVSVRSRCFCIYGVACWGQQMLVGRISCPSIVSRFLTWCIHQSVCQLRLSSTNVEIYIYIYRERERERVVGGIYWQCPPQMTVFLIALAAFRGHMYIYIYIYIHMCWGKPIATSTPAYLLCFTRFEEISGYQHWLRGSARMKL